MSAHPETARLAREAFDATGCKTHPEFVALMQGAIGLRTLRRWLAGEGPADALAQLVLRELIAGWRPKPTPASIDAAIRRRVGPDFAGKGNGS